MSSTMNRYWIPNWNIHKRVITQQLPFYLGPQATVRPYTLEVLQIQRIVLVEPGSHHPGRGWLPHLDSRRVSDRCKHAIMLKYERDSWP